MTSIYSVAKTRTAWWVCVERDGMRVPLQRCASRAEAVREKARRDLRNLLLLSRVAQVIAQ